MPLPETVAVRYTEDEAGYVSVRPVVRQTFRMAELLDMLLGVAGKDAPRLQKILRAGTVSFHAYRYWWEGFDAGEQELQLALAAYPDADPARPFRAEECAAILFEQSHPAPRLLLELKKEAGSRRRLLKRRTVWDALLDWARSRSLVYRSYAYGHRADAFFLPLSPPELASLLAQLKSLAPRQLGAALRRIQGADRATFLCPRPPSC